MNRAQMTRAATLIIAATTFLCSTSATTEPSPSLSPDADAARPAATPTTLENLLKQEGFEVVKLNLGVMKLNQEIRNNQKALKNVGKNLIIDVKINGVSGSLMLDTGVANTNIARSRLKKFGLVEEWTSYRVTGALGEASNKFFGKAELNTLAVGDCVLTNVPILIDAIPFLDGILGAEEMHRIGAVLDCAAPALYCAHRGASSDTSNKLAAILQNKGFTQVPMRLNPNHRLEVAGSIDGVPSTMIVDTGSPFTCVDESIGIKAGIVMKQTTAVLMGQAGVTPRLSTGRVKKLTIGNFEIEDADIRFVDLKKAEHPYHPPPSWDWRAGIQLCNY